VLVVAGFENPALHVEQSREHSTFAVVGERGERKPQPQRDT
jgi:hypothetical protein